MGIETIRWKGGLLELLDQRILPGKVEYKKCRTAKDVWHAINTLVVRGAPAIGVAAAYGAYLGVSGIKGGSVAAFKKKFDETVDYLSTARPTARNLFWALEEVQTVMEDNSFRTVAGLKGVLLDKAHAMLEEDNAVCRDIGLKGSKLVPRRARVLTHCNAGGLATAGLGTALSVVYAAKGKISRVYADETRPVLQGARLTVWELLENDVPTTLICDNMAASLMAKGEIDIVIVGADRIASNGDTANKIGTYNLAVLCKHHGIPFYVAAPVSTFDLSLKEGEEIPIEERDAEEVREIAGNLVTVAGVDVRNPAFDVTPASLITAIITERGVIEKPTKTKIEKTIKK